MRKSKVLTLVVFGALLGASFLSLNADIPSITTTEGKQNPVITNIDQLSNLAGNVNELDKEKVLTNRYQTTPESPTYEYPNQSTTIKLNSSIYKPGETAAVNITSDVNGLNGTLNWDLTNPLGEQYFGFTNDLTRVVFEDPNFNDAPMIKDWTNGTLDNKSLGFQGFSSLESENRLKLEAKTNLTASVDIIESRITYNGSVPISTGIYRFSFNYYTTGDKVPLMVYIWNGTQYQKFEAPAGGTSLAQKSFSVGYLNISYLSSDSQIFLNTSNANTTWYLDNFDLNYDFPEVALKLTGATETKQGTIIETYEDQNVGIQNNVSVSYVSSYSREESTSYANFTIKLPDKLVYLGNWRFSLSFQPYRLTTEENPEPISTPRIEYKIPLNITDKIVFQSDQRFMQRGFNDTDSSYFYENETNQPKIFSPGDRITEIGQLMYTSNNESFEGVPYSNVNGYVFSNASGTNLKDYTWGEGLSIIQNYNLDGKSIADGNFSLIDIENVTKTWGINYMIPLRGLYGNISNTLVVNFPNSLTFDDQVTPNAGDDAQYKYDLGIVESKFKTEIISETLPFDRVYYITEFLEGEFTVNTTHYNSTLNTVYDNHNITIELNIPRSDLSFNVFFAQENENKSVMDFVVNLETNNFFFSQKIDPNLNIPSLYDLRISWLDAFNAGDKEESELVFANSNSKTHKMNIQGTLRMNLPLDIFEVHQNENIEINFNVSIEELDTEARGLRISGLLCDSDGSCTSNSPKIPIEEIDGKFTIFYTVQDTIDVGERTLKLFTQNGVELGEITLVILPERITPNAETPELIIIIGSGLVVIVLLGYLAVILMKFK